MSRYGLLGMKSAHAIPSAVSSGNAPLALVSTITVRAVSSDCRSPSARRSHEDCMPERPASRSPRYWAVRLRWSRVRSRRAAVACGTEDGAPSKRAYRRARCPKAVKLLISFKLRWEFERRLELPAQRANPSGLRGWDPQQEPKSDQLPPPPPPRPTAKPGAPASAR